MIAIPSGAFHFDFRAGRVRRQVDRRHRVAFEVGDVGGFAVGGDRDPERTFHFDFRAGRVRRQVDRRHRVAFEVGDVGGFAVGGDRDKRRVCADFDFRAGFVRRQVDRRHRVAFRVGDVGGFAVGGDRDPRRVCADFDFRAGCVRRHVDRRDRAASGVGDVGGVRRRARSRRTDERDQTPQHHQQQSGTHTQATTRPSHQRLPFLSLRGCPPVAKTILRYRDGRSATAVVARLVSRRDTRTSTGRLFRCLLAARLLCRPST